jgi:hypothetical protein
MVNVGLSMEAGNIAKSGEIVNRAQNNQTTRQNCHLLEYTVLAVFDLKIFYL